MTFGYWSVEGYNVNYVATVPQENSATVSTWLVPGTEVISPVKEWKH